MAFTPFAGSDGRIKSIAVSPALTLPMPSTPTAGSTAAAAGIDSWKIAVEVSGSEGFAHFESTQAATGPLWEEQIQGGIVRWSADIEGAYDNDTTATWTKFFIGQICEVDFIFSKGAPWGRFSNVVKIVSYNENTEVAGKRLRFSAKLAGHGALTTPAAS